MTKREYRVVIQREGYRKKVKRFATRKGAERRLQLLLSDEPWKILHPGKSPDDPLGCADHMCGCCGPARTTVRDHELAVRRNLPPLISAHLESRTVGEWTAEGTDG